MVLSPYRVGTILIKKNTYMTDEESKKQENTADQPSGSLSLDNSAPADGGQARQDDPTGGHIPDDIFKAPEGDDQPQAAGPGNPVASAPEKPAPSNPASNPTGAAPASKPAAPPTGGTPAQKKKKFAFKSGGLGSKSNTQTKPVANTPKQDSNVPRGALNAVITRNEYYRDGYRNLMKIAFLEGIIIAGLLVAFIVYMNVHQERNRYFATTADGRILQLSPLDQPNITQAALMSWVSQAATETMTFGFHDYQRRLQDASRHFTRRGWESFTTALQRSRIIESVENLQQVVTATPRSAPVLLEQGIFNGRYRWIVRLPMTVTFTSGNKSNSSNLEITITIERVPTLESPNGVGIESWIAV